MKVNISAEIREILLVLSVLLGRIPLWFLLFACLIYDKFSLTAFLYLLVLVSAARGFILSYEKNLSFVKSGLIAFFRVLKPLIVLTAADIIFVSMLVIVLEKDTLGLYFILCLGLFAIAAVSLKFFTPPSQVEKSNTVIVKNFFIRLSLNIFWLYILLTPKDAYFSMILLSTIYMVEYLSVRRLDMEGA